MGMRANNGMLEIGDGEYIWTLQQRNGILLDDTDLQAIVNAIADKADSEHGHVAADISDFTAEVDARVQQIVDASPANLDTLNELAAALGDDPNFATTILNAIAAKPSLLQVYPIGSVYISVVNTNPGTLFGGTWVAFAAGRTLVGLDAGQTEFDTVEETGGAKTHTLQTSEIPAHTHPVTSQTATTGSATSYEHGALDTSSAEAEVTEVTGSTGGGAAHNNLQPYIVTYMFKRTA